MDQQKQEMMMSALKESAQPADSGMQLKVDGQIMTDPVQIVQFILANKDKYMPVDEGLEEMSEEEY